MTPGTHPIPGRGRPYPVSPFDTTRSYPAFEGETGAPGLAPGAPSFRAVETEFTARWELGERPRVEIWDMVRTIATARILMPGSMVRLSAGRLGMSESDQALCFLAGANSIFAGEKLLTTPNPESDRDRAMFGRLGLKPRPACDGSRAEG